MVLLRIPGAPSLVAEITQILQQTLPLLWSLGSAARALQQFGACGVKEFTSNRFQSQIIKLYKIQVLQTGFRLHRLGCNSQKWIKDLFEQQYSRVFLDSLRGTPIPSHGKCHDWGIPNFCRNPYTIFRPVIEPIPYNYTPLYICPFYSRKSVWHPDLWWWYIPLNISFLMVLLYPPLSSIIQFRCPLIYLFKIRLSWPILDTLPPDKKTSQHILL